jgi:hypothetical protein
METSIVEIENIKNVLCISCLKKNLSSIRFIANTCFIIVFHAKCLIIKKNEWQIAMSGRRDPIVVSTSST